MPEAFWRAAAIFAVCLGFVCVITGGLIVAGLGTIGIIVPVLGVILIISTVAVVGYALVKSHSTHRYVIPEVTEAIVVDDPELFCPISGSLLNDPVRTKCNHVFNRRAILAWLVNKHECGLCRRPIRAHELEDDITVANKVRATVALRPELQKEYKQEDNIPFNTMYRGSTAMHTTFKQLKQLYDIWSEFERDVIASQLTSSPSSPSDVTTVPIPASEDRYTQIQPFLSRFPHLTRPFKRALHLTERALGPELYANFMEAYMRNLRGDEAHLNNESGAYELQGPEKDAALSNEEYLDVEYYGTHIYKADCHAREPVVLRSGKHIIVNHTNLTLSAHGGLKMSLIPSPPTNDKSEELPSSLPRVWSPFFGMDTLFLDGKMLGTWDRRLQQYTVIVNGSDGSLLRFTSDSDRSLQRPARLTERGSAYVAFPL
eukprot:CAMPEP_0184665488 /NCGR_PEP_ID=MMETSP0308-20130426/57417_1 /TAXON_ID=38269 /ORGANISM="Gloeochaete witrockiana, Strain SAG 46.84" /LENGTH=429 /DNA_ID=CAMNT_0027109515 /DNA_START=181 /DNA_END=1473 /DNA_ORIENTATION=+